VKLKIPLPLPHCSLPLYKMAKKGREYKILYERTWWTSLTALPLFSSHSFYRKETSLRLEFWKSFERLYMYMPTPLSFLNFSLIQCVFPAQLFRKMALARWNWICTTSRATQLIQSPLDTVKKSLKKKYYECTSVWRKAWIPKGERQILWNSWISKLDKCVLSYGEGENILNFNVEIAKPTSWKMVLSLGWHSETKS
jgi:hypothetical protein